MRLVDIFEDRAIDFEISTHELPKFEENSKAVGTFDGYEIRGERFNQAVDAYGVIDNDVPIAVAFVETREQLISGKKVQRLIKIWVDKQARGRGAASSLLMFIIRKFDTKLLVNDYITAAGEGLIKRLVQSKRLDITGVVNGQMIDATIDELLNIPNKYWLILESQPTTQDQELFEGQLSHYRLFRGDESYD